MQYKSLYTRLFNAVNAGWELTEEDAWEVKRAVGGDVVDVAVGEHDGKQRLVAVRPDGSRKFCSPGWVVTALKARERKSGKPCWLPLGETIPPHFPLCVTTGATEAGFEKRAELACQREVGCIVLQSPPFVTTAFTLVVDVKLSSVARTVTEPLDLLQPRHEYVLACTDGWWSGWVLEIVRNRWQFRLGVNETKWEHILPANLATRPGRWTRFHIVADGLRVKAWVAGDLVADAALPGPFTPSHAPIRASSSAHALLNAGFDGKFRCLSLQPKAVPPSSKPKRYRGGARPKPPASPRDASHPAAAFGKLEERMEMLQKSVERVERRLAGGIAPVAVRVLGPHERAPPVEDDEPAAPGVAAPAPGDKRASAGTKSASDSARGSRVQLLERPSFDTPWVPSEVADEGAAGGGGKKHPSLSSAAAVRPAPLSETLLGRRASPLEQYVAFKPSATLLSDTQSPPAPSLCATSCATQSRLRLNSLWDSTSPSFRALDDTGQARHTDNVPADMADSAIEFKEVRSSFLDRSQNAGKPAEPSRDGPTTPETTRSSATVLSKWRHMLHDDKQDQSPSLARSDASAAQSPQIATDTFLDSVLSRDSFTKSSAKLPRGSSVLAKWRSRLEELPGDDSQIHDTPPLGDTQSDLTSAERILATDALPGQRDNAEPKQLAFSDPLVFHQPSDKAPVSDDEEAVIDVEPWIQRIKKLTPPNYSTRSLNLPAEVRPGLFLGDSKMAKKVIPLASRGIQKVLNLAPSQSRTSKDTYVGTTIQYKEIAAEDSPTYPILDHLQEVVEYVGDPKETPTLIHCFQGVNRSAVLLAACIMCLYRVPLLQAITEVWQARPVVFVGNDAFLAALVRHADKINLLGEPDEETEDDEQPPHPGEHPHSSDYWSRRRRSLPTENLTALDFLDGSVLDSVAINAVVHAGRRKGHSSPVAASNAKGASCESPDKRQAPADWKLSSSQLSGSFHDDASHGSKRQATPLESPALQTSRQDSLLAVKRSSSQLSVSFYDDGQQGGASRNNNNNNNSANNNTNNSTKNNKPPESPHVSPLPSATLNASGRLLGSSAALPPLDLASPTRTFSSRGDSTGGTPDQASIYRDSFHSASPDGLSPRGLRSSGSENALAAKPSFDIARALFDEEGPARDAVDSLLPGSASSDKRVQRRRGADTATATATVVVPSRQSFNDPNAVLPSRSEAAVVGAGGRGDNAANSRGRRSRASSNNNADNNNDLSTTNNSNLRGNAEAALGASYDGSSHLGDVGAANGNNAENNIHDTFGSPMSPDNNALAAYMDMNDNGDNGDNNDYNDDNDSNDNGNHDNDNIEWNDNNDTSMNDNDENNGTASSSMRDNADNASVTGRAAVPPSRADHSGFVLDSNFDPIPVLRRRNDGAPNTSTATTATPLLDDDLQVLRYPSVAASSAADAQLDNTFAMLHPPRNNQAPPAPKRSNNTVQSTPTTTASLGDDLHAQRYPSVVASSVDDQGNNFNLAPDTPSRAQLDNTFAMLHPPRNNQAPPVPKRNDTVQSTPTTTASLGDDLHAQRYPSVVASSIDDQGNNFARDTPSRAQLDNTFAMLHPPRNNQTPPVSRRRTDTVQNTPAAASLGDDRNVQRYPSVAASSVADEHANNFARDTSSCAPLDNTFAMLHPHRNNQAPPLAKRRNDTAPNNSFASHGDARQMMRFPSVAASSVPDDHGNNLASSCAQLDNTFAMLHPHHRSNQTPPVVAKRRNDAAPGPSPSLDVLRYPSVAASSPADDPSSFARDTSSSYAPLDNTFAMLHPARKNQAPPTARRKRSSDSLLPAGIVDSFSTDTPANRKPDSRGGSLVLEESANERENPVGTPMTRTPRHDVEFSSSLLGEFVNEGTPQTGVDEGPAVLLSTPSGGASPGNKTEGGASFRMGGALPRPRKDAAAAKDTAVDDLLDDWKPPARFQSGNREAAAAKPPLAVPVDDNLPSDSMPPDPPGAGNSRRCSQQGDSDWDTPETTPVTVKPAAEPSFEAPEAPAAGQEDENKWDDWD
ncbi:hypothetical protein DIPPA_00814 [Diplonema papillatum]|nr:hypothetical protein DIPPA_00814 [Diplonema papillatum]